MTQPPAIPPATSPDPVPLSYETPGPIAITSTRQAAWIALFTNGILALLCGGCVAAMFGFAGIVFLSLGRHGAGARPAPAVALIIAILIGLIPFALGTTSIVCSFKIRKGSSAATITGLIITLLQFLAFAAITIISLVAALTDGSGDLAEKITSIAMFTAGAALQAVLIWLLIRVLREPRPTIING